MKVIWGIECPAFKTVMKKRLSERKNPMRVPVTKMGKDSDGDTFTVPDEIIARLTKECDGNVDDHNIVEVASGLFEKETVQFTLRGKNEPQWTATNAADVEAKSCFRSVFRNRSEGVTHPRNNWRCCDLKERRIVPTHYRIRAYSGSCHLKSRLVEKSADGKKWREMDDEEKRKQLNGSDFAATFARITLGMTSSTGISRSWHLKKGRFSVESK
jgi:hypothetical protein